MSPQGPRPRDYFPSLLSQGTASGSASGRSNSHHMAGEEKENGGGSSLFYGLGVGDRSHMVSSQVS